ncbi:hypothetical protein [Streptomyces sp. NPDC003952]
MTTPHQPEQRDEPRGNPLRLAATSGAWLAPSFLLAYLLADVLTTGATARTWCTLLLAPVIGLALRLITEGLKHARRSRHNRP